MKATKDIECDHWSTAKFCASLDTFSGADLAGSGNLTCSKCGERLGFGAWLKLKSEYAVLGPKGWNNPKLWIDERSPTQKYSDGWERTFGRR